MALPETGASTMSAPFSRTFAHTTRLKAGLTVLISISTLPASKPARTPSGPSIMEFKASDVVTIENVKSQAVATSRGEAAHCIPFSIRRSALARVRLYPLTACPFWSKRKTISLPITPRPTKPSLAIAWCLRPARCCQQKQFLLRLLFARVFSDLAQMRAHGFPCALRIAVLDRLQNPLVMILAALWPALDIVGAHTLLAQQSNNGINQGGDQRVGSCFGKRQVKI